MHLIFQEARILLMEAGGLYLPAAVPTGAMDPPGGELRLGPEPEAPRVLLWPPDAPPPPGTGFQGLRAALPLLDPGQLRWAGRGRQLLERSSDSSRIIADGILADLERVPGPYAGEAELT